MLKIDQLNGKYPYLDFQKEREICRIRLKHNRKYWRTAYGNAPATIDWLLTDSRSLNFPEETLFFALTTKRNDGARYIADLYARGVRNFVLSEESFRLIEHGELKIDNDAQQPAIHFQSSTVNYLIVSNPLKALQKLAEQHRNRFQIPVIGITGSNGKTVVKEWLHQLLSPERAIIRSPRSYNSQIGVPLSVWQMNEQSELAIFEAGISEPGGNARFAEHH